MGINRKLLTVLIIASIAPAVYYRINDWIQGRYNSYYELFESLLINTLISLIVTLSVSWVILKILSWLNKKYPWDSNILKRLMVEVGLTFPTAMLLGYGFGNAVYFINPNINKSYSEFIFSFIGISAIMNFVLVAVSDWFYFFEKWKETLVQNERKLKENEILEKEKITAQYEALKNQVNPHFLFNSLNILSVLIHTEPQKAEDFIDEFANLYRYVLDNSKKQTVQLEKEINVVKSYTYMQEIRFGRGVKCEFNFTNDMLSQFHVFPLSVQTLIENAVKHNIVSERQPLNIKLTIANNELTVSNNIQLRDSTGSSTGIGTKNLLLRYKPFNTSPKFIMTETHYIATLPLLTNKDLLLINES